MKSMSPCAKSVCINKDKKLCCGNCKELNAYQRHLFEREDHYSPPGIDYSDTDRVGVHFPKNTLEDFD